jgi:hypothetical protein
MPSHQHHTLVTRQHMRAHMDHRAHLPDNVAAVSRMPFHHVSLRLYFACGWIMVQYHRLLFRPAPLLAMDHSSALLR